MSQWIYGITQHAVWTALTMIEPSVNDALSREGNLPTTLDSLERLRSVVKFGQARLLATDPILIPYSALDNLIQPLNELKNHIDLFTISGHELQLTGANVQADQFLINLKSILVVTTQEDFKDLAEAAASYRKTLNKHLSDALDVQTTLLEKASANDSKIKEIEAALTSEQQRLSSLINDHQTQFSSAQDKRASDFATSQAESLTNNAAVISEQKSQFSADQDARRTAFADFQRENQERLSNLLSSFDQKLKDHTIAFEAKEKQTDEENKKNIQLLQAGYEEKANIILEEIKRHKSEVESLVGVIGNLGVTSGYKKVADYARWMVGIWQFLTVLSLVGLIFVAFRVAFPAPASEKQISSQTSVAINSESGKAGTSKPATEKDQANSVATKVTVVAAVDQNLDSNFYQGFLTRIFLSITFGIFAAYSGRQASRFFDMEQRNRKLALELEALGPFIEPLDKADRDKFRVQIGDRSFGVADPETGKVKENDPITALVISKAKEIGEFITNFVKLVKS